MRTALLGAAAALSALAGACASDNYGQAPYYGRSQGYAYPEGYQASGHTGHGYRAPYGYPYGGAGQGPSITLNIPQG